MSRSVPFCAAGMDLPFLCNQCTLRCIQQHLDNRTSLRRSHTPAYISIRMCEPLTGSKRKRTRPHKRGALTQKQAHDHESCALEGTFVGDRPSSYDNIPGQHHLLRLLSYLSPELFYQRLDMTTRPVSRPLVILVDDIGLEPMTLRTSSECSSQLS